MTARTRRSPWFRQLLGGCAVLLAPLACGEPAEVGAAPVAENPIAVEVHAVAPERVAPTLAVSGLVEAKREVALAFRVTGFVERFHVDEGDRVEEGQVLAELDLADFDRDVRGARARLSRAEAHARNAAQSYERQRQLREKGTSSQRAYDEARSAHQMATAERTEARMELERAEDRNTKATLRSPLTGFVARRLLEPHELASSDVPVLELVQLDEVTVRAGIADTRLANLRVGGPAFVTSPQWGERRFEGRIVRIGVAADPSTRTVPFEVELANPDLAFRPDLVVRVEIPSDASESLILVPLASVLRDARLSPFCFVATDGPGALRAERRDVTIGRVVEGRVVVRTGLASGDRLVTRGQHFLRPGDALRIAEE